MKPSNNSTKSHSLAIFAHSSNFFKSHKCMGVYIAEPIVAVDTYPILFAIDHTLSLCTELSLTVNGKISVKSDKILKNKLFEKISLITNVSEGNLDFNETILINEKIGDLKILRSSFIEKDDKIFLEAKAVLNIKELDSFYKKLLIPKSKRKDLKKIEFSFEFDTINTNFKVNKINFYNLKNKKINSEKIDDLVDGYVDKRFEYLNSNGFKNFLKEIINSYFELG